MFIGISAPKGASASRGICIPAFALGISLLWGSTAEAASHDHAADADHATHSEPAAPTAQGPVIDAWRAVNEQMHADMAIDYTGDADVDFAVAMIGHHEGAIAMALIVLEHGEDPEVRKLAEEVIAAQEREVAFLKDWLRRRQD